jgi:wingless-type MMTV integration site family protein 16
MLLFNFQILISATSNGYHPYNWLSLALSGTAKYEKESKSIHAREHFRSLCHRLTGLNPRQRDLCETYPLTIPAIARSAREAIYECQIQFKHERWNCSERFDVYPNTSAGGLVFQDLLGKTLRGGNRESAFLTAITSAGVVHAITKLCSIGNMTECTCNNQPSMQRYTDTNTIQDLTYETVHKIPPKSPFTWGGCSDDTSFATQFARQFLDSFDQEMFRKTRDSKYLMNIHNNFVGREAITQNMRRHCRCHGVSGSCELQTCWLQMPKFNEIGEMLKQRYNHFAIQVAKRAKKRLRRKERSERMIPLRGNEMAYIYRSPNYCERNDTFGIIGTHNRECNNTSYGADSCDLLCCGRGYNTRDEIRSVRCHCKFVWCCYVKCKECKEHVQIHTCK